MVHFSPTDFDKLMEWIWAFPNSQEHESTELATWKAYFIDLSLLDDEAGLMKSTIGYKKWGLFASSNSGVDLLKENETFEVVLQFGNHKKIRNAKFHFWFDEE